MNIRNYLRSILLEGGDSRLKPVKNIIKTSFEGTALNPDSYVTSAEYQVPNKGEQTTWMHYLIYSLRHFFELMGNSDVPMLRNVAKIAFLELNFEKENQDLHKLNVFKKIINLIKNDDNAKSEFIQSDNITFNTLYEQYADVLKQMDDEQRSAVNSKSYERNSRYKIIPIDDFETANKFGKYTGNNREGRLCYTERKQTWDNFTHGGNNQCYLCYLPNYKKIPPQKSEGYPKDEYGLSMIWLFVDEKGNISNSNVRWNHGDHSYSNVDNIFTESEISDIVGVNFYETFKPNNAWDEKLADAMEKIANGVDPKDVFDEFDKIENGLALVKMNGKCNLLSADGKILSDTWFDNCLPFIDGLAFVKLNDKWNVLTTDGKILSDTWFDVFYDFKGGFARVKLNGKWNFLTKDGKFLSDIWFDECYVFKNGLAYVYLNGKRNFLTTDGKILSDTWFDYCGEFYEGFARVKVNNKWNFLTRDGKILSDTWFDGCDNFENGYVRVELNYKDNFLTADGNFLSDTWFDECGILKNGLALVCLNGKYNFLTADGKILSDVWFDDCFGFRNGFAEVRLNDKWLKIDRNGTIKEPSIGEGKRNRKPILITKSDLRKIVKESVRLALKNAVI